MHSTWHQESQAHWTCTHVHVIGYNGEHGMDLWKMPWTNRRSTDDWLFMDIWRIVTRVVYHLHKDSSIYEWKINETHIFGRPNRKITGINVLLEKVVFFDRLKRFKRFISFHLHLFWAVVLVPNKFITCFYTFRCFRSYGKWKAHTPNEIFQFKFLRSICTISNQMVFSCKW